MWLPDGQGLSETVKEIIDELPNERVHLRLTSQVDPDRHPRTACGALTSIGQWWSGKPSEVNCPACLKLAPARLHLVRT